MKIASALLLTSVVLFASSYAAAQTYPARTIGARLSGMWGQQVVVDNRPGGATSIGSELAGIKPL